MPAVTTQADNVVCGHPAGKVTTVGAPKLTVNGSPALLAAGVMGKPIVGCLTPLNAMGSPPTKPCTTVMAVDNPPSLATKLNVSGAPVVLATLKGATDGLLTSTLPENLLAATVAQIKLFSV